MKIRMLDDDGNVTEECAVTRSFDFADSLGEHCEDSGEHHGALYSWECADGMKFEVCDLHLSLDVYAELDEEAGR